MMIRYTIFRSVSAQEKHDVYEDWPTFVSRVVNPRVTFGSKAMMPLISCGQYGELRTKAGALRSRMNLIAVHGIEIDYDDEAVALSPVLDLLDAAGIAALGYTSPSHRPDAPHWRLIFPLSRDRPPGDRVVYVEMVNALLGGIAAPESGRLAQSFYIGKCGEFYAARATLSVRCIDTAGELPRRPLGEPKVPAPADDAVVAPRRPRPEGNSIIDRWNARVTVAELLRRNDYRQIGDRWISPTSTSGIAGVVELDDGRVFSHHGPLDLLSQHNHAGHALDAFDVLCTLECAGDFRRALDAAKRLLDEGAAQTVPVGVSRAARRRP